MVAEGEKRIEPGNEKPFGSRQRPRTSQSSESCAT